MKIQVLFQQQKENILTLTISTTMDLSGFLRSTLCGPGMDFATAFMIFIRSIPLFARASYNTANCTEVQKSQTPSQYVIRFQIVMYTVAKGCSLHRYYIGTQPNSQQNLVDTSISLVHFVSYSAGNMKRESGAGKRTGQTKLNKIFIQLYTS